MRTACPAHRGSQGFTLAEVLIATVGSVIVIGALMAGSLGLQKAFHASECYADDQSSQRRLIDWVARDVRRSVGLSTTNNASGASARVSGGSVTVDEATTLVVTLPAYYRSNAPTDYDYDAPLPLVASGDQIAYGTSAGPSPAYPVTFRKLYMSGENCVCFVRDEGDVRQVIARDAQDLTLQLDFSADGVSCTLTTQFQAHYSRNHVSVEVHDEVMLRNTRID